MKTADVQIIQRLNEIYDAQAGGLASSFAAITGDPSDNTALDTALNLKQTAAQVQALIGGINVKSAPYNAAGDGVTDDSAEITAAILAASAQGVSVYFPPTENGYYFAGASYSTILSNTTLVGNNTKIVAASHTTMNPVFTGSSVDKVTITGFRFVSTPATVRYNNGDADFDTAVGEPGGPSAASVASFRQALQFSGVSNLLVKDCSFDGLSYGVKVDTGPNSYVSILNNTFRNVTGQGIYISRTDKLTIDGAKFFDVGQCRFDHAIYGSGGLTQAAIDNVIADNTAGTVIDIYASGASSSGITIGTLKVKDSRSTLSLNQDNTYVLSNVNVSDVISDNNSHRDFNIPRASGITISGFQVIDSQATDMVFNVGLVDNLFITAGVVRNSPVPVVLFTGVANNVTISDVDFIECANSNDLSISPIRDSVDSTVTNLSLNELRFLYDNVAANTASIDFRYATSGVIDGIYANTTTTNIRGVLYITTLANMIVKNSTAINHTLGLLHPASVGAHPGGIPGVRDGGDADPGNVGEYISSSIVVGSATALTTATPKTVTSISLTAGDWDVTAIGALTGASTGTAFDVAIGTTTNSFTGTVLGDTRLETPTVSLTDADASLMVPSVRINVSATTTYYLVVQEVFTIGSPAAYGRLSARRVR